MALSNRLTNNKFIYSPVTKVRFGEWLCENVLGSNFNRIIYLSCENIGDLGIIIPLYEVSR